MKSILIHVKNEDVFRLYIKILENPKFRSDVALNKEVQLMIKDFVDNNWEVYLTTLENIDCANNTFNNIYHVNSKSMLNMNIDEVNDKIKIIIVRNLGSIEQKFNMIQEYLKYLLKNYKGKVLNNINAMLKGMTKNYLTEIEEDELAKFNVLTIPTRIFLNTVSFDEIISNYPSNREKYLIKPLTGELSNSLKCLSDIDEEFLRYKESKVGGWVIQPIQKDIWNGEYQVSFLDGKKIFSQIKKYPHEGNIPDQKRREIKNYNLEKEEEESLINVVNYFKKLYKIDIDICRIDYMKNKNNQLILLEFEMVNPGFFLAYMEPSDDRIRKIIKAIREYCEKFV